MGLLDEILKSLEEAQREAEGRRAPRPATRPHPERDADESEADVEADDDEGEPVHRTPPRVQRQPPTATAPPPPAAQVVKRRVADSAPALARHVLSGPQAADRIRALMRNPQALRDALVAREILGPPPGLRRLRRR